MDNQTTEHAHSGLSYFLAKVASLALIVAMLAGYSIWAGKANAHDEAVAAQIAEAERAASRGPYPVDGTFTGSAIGFGGPVTMQVAIENGYIDEVVILDASLEDPPWLEMTAHLPGQIVREQTTQLDIVSGATYTSAGILNGTTEALRAAQGGAQ